MNAQQLINETITEKETDYLKDFYPQIWVQEQADKDLSKCARDQDGK